MRWAPNRTLFEITRPSDWDVLLLLRQKRIFFHFSQESSTVISYQTTNQLTWSFFIYLLHIMKPTDDEINELLAKITNSQFQIMTQPLHIFFSLVHQAPAAHSWHSKRTTCQPTVDPNGRATCTYLIFISARSTSPDKCLHHLSMTTLSSQLEWSGLSYAVPSWYHTLPVKLHQLFNHTYGTLHSCNVCARVSILKHSNVSIPPMKTSNVVAYRS